MILEGSAVSGVGKIEKKAGNRFLSYYELEAIHRDGSTSPYYMASRNPDTAALTAVTHQNRPNGVSIYSLLGEKVVLVRQYRYPVGGYVYEFPAGLVEPGEISEPITLAEPLAAGVYPNALLKFDCYTMDGTMRALNGAATKMTLHVS